MFPKVLFLQAVCRNDIRYFFYSSKTQHKKLLVTVQSVYKQIVVMRLSMFTKYFVCFIHVFTAIPLDGAQMMLSIKLFNFNISTMHTNSQYKRLLFSYLIVFFVIVSGFKILNFLKVNHFWQFNSGQRNVN